MGYKYLVATIRAGEITKIELAKVCPSPEGGGTCIVFIGERYMEYWAEARGESDPIAKFVSALQYDEGWLQ